MNQTAAFFGFLMKNLRRLLCNTSYYWEWCLKNIFRKYCVYMSIISFTKYILPNIYFRLHMERMDIVSCLWCCWANRFCADWTGISKQILKKVKIVEKYCPTKKQLFLEWSLVWQPVPSKDCQKEGILTVRIYINCAEIPRGNEPR